MNDGMLDKYTHIEKKAMNKDQLEIKMGACRYKQAVKTCNDHNSQKPLFVVATNKLPNHDVNIAAPQQILQKLLIFVSWGSRYAPSTAQIYLKSLRPQSIQNTTDSNGGNN